MGPMAIPLAIIGGVGGMGLSGASGGDPLKGLLAGAGLGLGGAGLGLGGAAVAAPEIAGATGALGLGDIGVGAGLGASEFGAGLGGGIGDLAASNVIPEIAGSTGFSGLDLPDFTGLSMPEEMSSALSPDISSLGKGANWGVIPSDFSSSSGSLGLGKNELFKAIARLYGVKPSRYQTMPEWQQTGIGIAGGIAPILAMLSKRRY